MNRHERRRQAAMARQNQFYQDYVHHLPEVAPENVADKLSKPGVLHAVHYHEEWCEIYDGAGCNCNPEIRFFSEPARS